MSITNFPGSAHSSPLDPSITKVTIPALAEMKRQGKPISALTAYDYATSRLVDEAGIDLVLVGDSLAMVVMGHDNTLAVTVDEMLHHTRAVRRAVRRALVVADMPFGSYHVTVAEGVGNAVRFIKEAGAEAVKIEGPRIALVKALTDAEIPVIGHLGLTPQSVHRMGGYRVQAKTMDAAQQIKADARALEEAGAGVLVLEGIPREVAAEITAELTIPAETAVVALHLAYQNSMELYVNCDAEKNTFGDVWYRVAEIALKGYVAANGCAKAKVNDKFKTTAAPGELIMFVREKNLKERAMD